MAEAMQTAQSNVSVVALEIRRAVSGAFVLEAVISNGTINGKRLEYAGELDDMLRVIKEAYHGPQLSGPHWINYPNDSNGGKEGSGEIVSGPLNGLEAA